MNYFETIRDLAKVAMPAGFEEPQAIYKWQQGAALPTVDNLVVLSAVFGVPLERILAVEKC